MQSGFSETESPEFRRRRKEILGSFTNCSLLLLPSSFLPIISSLVKKCNYFSSKVFSNERSPTRPTVRRRDGSTDRPSRARASTTHARWIGRDGRRQRIKAILPSVGQSERRRRNNKYPCWVTAFVSLFLLAAEEFIIPQLVFRSFCPPYIGFDNECVPRWADRRALGSEKFLPGPAWLLHSKTSPPFIPSL